MPTIVTTDWLLDSQVAPLLVSCAGGLRLPVLSKKFIAPNDNHAVVYPSGYLSPDLWKRWVMTCQRYASFDVLHKRWVFSCAVLDRVSSENEAAGPIKSGIALTKEERLKIKQERALAEEKFNQELTELSKEENVPENLWTTYQYPPRLVLSPSAPTPTALQRIVVSRYWNQPYALIAASVGTGKTRMVVDILSARATSPSLSLQNSARITLIVAPLALHENWKREFAKWSCPGAEFHCHIFAPTDDFWKAAEKSATKMFDGPTMGVGGVVIVVTPNALSRDKFRMQMEEHAWVPTAVVIDEVQRMFRKPGNKAFKNLSTMRKAAHIFLGLSGTPTSKFEDWWALEELMAGTDARAAHWKGASYLDYQRLGDKELMTSSGLWHKGWTYERAIKEYHAQRIKARHIFVADKNYYMRDSLPGIGQEEIGDYADLRLSFGQLFEQYPELVKDAFELQKKCSGKDKFEGDERMLATVLMLRMRQLAALSPASDALLHAWVNDFLEEQEPGVVWVEFVNEPCAHLDRVVDILNTYGPTCYVRGGMSQEMRQEAIDGFQAAKYRFFVAQQEAAGVGLTLTRSCKSLFLTVPLGYQTVSQAIGRQHRIGQLNDVLSCFAMSHPVACFARHLYDTRKELNEEIPAKISGVLPKGIVVDAPPTLT